MSATAYRGLAESGLPLVTQDDPSFAILVRDIENLPYPFSARSPCVSDRAAVLLNNTNRAVIALEWFWRYTSRDGKTRTSRFSNLGSSVQREVLTGRSKVRRDLGSYILPGSKRLITEHGIFGNNLDVLTPEELPQAQGFCGGWGGGSPRVDADTEFAATQLVLDLVILEDGLCVGPNESRLYEALNESLDFQRETAQEAVKALRAGASVGQIFEIVRPLAYDFPEEPQTQGKPRHARQIISTFGSEAVNHLINASPTDLLAFFEKAAEPRALQLRRPN